MAREGGGRPRRQALGGGRLGSDSPLLGGPLTAGAGAEESPPFAPGYDPRSDDLAQPRTQSDRPRGRDTPELAELSELMPEPDGERSLDDWGRSEAVVRVMDPLLDFYYRYWFRVEHEGIANVPSAGGALLVSNHSGALPPTAR
jgi:hypothetical protein